ncbi:hypothetical protein B0H14DRAFT_3580640, partial [Mycena olivaceomarginata]
RAFLHSSSCHKLEAESLDDSGLSSAFLGAPVPIFTQYKTISLGLLEGRNLANILLPMSTETLAAASTQAPRPFSSPVSPSPLSPTATGITLPRSTQPAHPENLRNQGGITQLFLGASIGASMCTLLSYRARCLISALRHVDHTPAPNASASANPCSGTRCTPVLALRVGGRCADTISAQRGHTECAPCPLAMLTESHAVGVRLDDKHNKRDVRCVSSCMYKIRPRNVRLSISSTASLDVRCAPAQARTSLRACSHGFGSRAMSRGQWVGSLASTSVDRVQI